MLERKEETKIVKRELAKYGINAKVGHGRGTAWGWLEMNVGSGQQFGEEHVVDEFSSHRECPRCRAANIIMRFAEKKAQEVTGRHGEYGGNICCLTQDHWSDKNGCSIPIEHDLPKLIKAIPELQALLKN